MSGMFELKKSKGQFMWNLKATNGKVILTSERYKSRGSAEAGIASVKKNCSSDKCYARKTTPSGKYRFNLLSTNGQVIGTSQNYASSSGRNNGIKSVRTNAKGTKIADLT